MKKLFYWSPYIPLFGILFVGYMEIRQKNCCIIEDKHNDFATIVQCITLMLIIILS